MGVPDTETMNIEAEENIETKECIVNVTDVLSLKETSNVDEELAEVQPDKEDGHEINEMDTNEDVVDNPASANAAISDNDVESDKQINKNKETNHQPDSSKDSVDLDDILALMDEDLELDNLSSEKLKIVFEKCTAHRRKVDNLSDKVAQILFRRLK